MPIERSACGENSDRHGLASSSNARFSRCRWTVCVLYSPHANPAARMHPAREGLGLGGCGYPMLRHLLLVYGYDTFYAMIALTINSDCSPT
jgi:hypothetical protein